MHVSVFDLFKIGIGPSSSHTMGPMTAACRFVREVERRGRLPAVARATVDLYGSLALTGKGHATDTAVTLGLSGWLPAEVDPDAAQRLVETVQREGALKLAGSHPVDFRPERDIQWHYKESLPFHPNGLTLRVFDAAGAMLEEGTFYSIGGGFVVTEAEARAGGAQEERAVPLPFSNAVELLEVAGREGIRIADVMLRNECAFRSEEEVRAGLDRIWQAMSDCIDRGLTQEGVLPGGLNVRRRAAKLR
ncbi:MAG TPA: serine dehydratase beta chain, partial [Steroidobacteraceae bacterium]